MIDYSVALCYGIIVSSDIMEEIKKVLTDNEYDELIDNYSRCINSWIGEDYFIGVSDDLSQTSIDNVYYVSNFVAPSDKDENFIDFKNFFDEHDLWKFIDWTPELMLINFCF